MSHAQSDTVASNDEAAVVRMFHYDDRGGLNTLFEEILCNPYSRGDMYGLEFVGSQVDIVCIDPAEIGQLIQWGSPSPPLAHPSTTTEAHAST